MELLRERADCLAEDDDLFHPYCYLTKSCPEDPAFYPDKIPPVGRFVDKVELFVTKVGLPHVQLGSALFRLRDRQKLFSRDS